jgi:hypothetical protein
MSDLPDIGAKRYRPWPVSSPYVQVDYNPSIIADLLEKRLREQVSADLPWFGYWVPNPLRNLLEVSPYFYRF